MTPVEGSLPKVTLPVSVWPITPSAMPVPDTTKPGARPPAVAPVVLSMTAKAPPTVTSGTSTATVADTVP